MFPLLARPNGGAARRAEPASSTAAASATASSATAMRMAKDRRVAAGRAASGAGSHLEANVQPGRWFVRRVAASARSRPWRGPCSGPSASQSTRRRSGVLVHRPGSGLVIGASGEPAMAARIVRAP